MHVVLNEWEIIFFQQNCWQHIIGLVCSDAVQHLYTRLFYCMSNWPIMDNPISHVTPSQ